MKGLKTKFNGELEDSNLEYLGKLKINVNLTSKVRLTDTFEYDDDHKGDYEIIGNGQFLNSSDEPVGKTITNIGSGAYYRFLSPGQYVLLVDKYNLRRLNFYVGSAGSFSVKAGDLLYLTNTRLVIMTPVNVNNKPVDCDAFHNTEFTTLSIEEIDVKLNFDNVGISNMASLRLSNNTRVTGSVLPIANASLSLVSLNGSLGIDPLTVEEFVAKMRTDAPSKTSVEIAIYSTSWTGITLAGQPISSYLNVSGAVSGRCTLSWTASTITLTDPNGLTLYTA